MSVRGFNPLTPVQRTKTVSDFAEITTDEPHGPLTEGLRKSGGRNNMGRITMRRIGGGARRRYRVIEWKRRRIGIPAVVETVEYDPNRSARICLLRYVDGVRTYILHPVGLKVGRTVMAGPQAPIEVGNSLPLASMPLGTWVHNLEIQPGRSSQMIRSAGAYGEILSREGEYVSVRLPSGEIRRVLGVCTATIGQIGNIDHENICLGSAGRARHLGRRPKVRGVAMNPVDHPMGGGEGKTSGGRHPVSPWGKPAKGGKTRNNKRTDKFIVRSRHGK